MQVSGLWQIHRTLQLSSSSNFRITSLLQKETLYLLAVTSSSPWTSFSHPWQTLVYLPVSVDLLIQSFYCQTIFHYMDMLIHQLMGIWIVSTLWLLWMMLWTLANFYHERVLNFVNNFCIYWEDHVVLVLYYLTWCTAVVVIQSLSRGQLCDPMNCPNLEYQPPLSSTISRVCLNSCPHWVYDAI